MEQAERQHAAQLELMDSHHAEEMEARRQEAEEDREDREMLREAFRQHDEAGHQEEETCCLPVWKDLGLEKEGSPAARRGRPEEREQQQALQEEEEEREGQEAAAAEPPPPSRRRCAYGSRYTNVQQMYPKSRNQSWILRRELQFM
ncbi:UNVERIFIED_CONTAM: hypothetical protein K2H54_012151, partial [Gekko kuhli]